MLALRSSDFFLSKQYHPAAAELMNRLALASENVAVEESKKVDNKSSFPWLYNILRMCRQALGTRHPSSLNGLLYAFVKELSISIKDCYSRPNRAAKLRNIVKELLVFFEMIYQDLEAEYMENTGTYLHLMTDILAMYLDLEIKASRRGVHSLKKIAQFMTTGLYTHLGQSEEHILEAILKAKLITKSAGELCAPVIFKVLNESKCFIGNGTAYVRFLLAFKLLHKITKGSGRRVVAKMAERKLNPGPELVETARKMNIFPVQNNKEESFTEFLMNAKFNFIKAKWEFLRRSNISRGSIVDLYFDKTFSFGNQSSNISSLMERNQRGVDDTILNSHYSSKNKDTYCSTFLELNPSVYTLSTRDLVGIGSGEDDASEIEFLGIQNKAERPVLEITLDSDGENDEAKFTNTAEKIRSEVIKESCNIEIADKHKVLKFKEMEDNDALSVSFSEKIQTYIKKSSDEEKNVPDYENSLKKVEEYPSTNNGEGELPSSLQSPDHGDIDSTSNVIDFIFDKSFRSPKQKTYNILSNSVWDEGRTEVSSSLDVIDSTGKRTDESAGRIKDFEITTTLEKSNHLNCHDDDVISVPDGLSNILQMHGNSVDAEPSHSEFLHDEYVDSSRSSSSVHVRENFDTNSPISSVKSRAYSTTYSKPNPLVTETKQRNLEEGQLSMGTNDNTPGPSTLVMEDYEKLKILYNYSVNPSIQEKWVEKEMAADSVNHYQSRFNKNTNQLVNSTEVMNEMHIVDSVAQGNDKHRESLPRSIPVTQSDLRLSIDPKAKNSSGNIYSNNSKELDNLIITKKVNYENVAKSYKIVKSNHLKRVPEQVKPNDRNIPCKSSDQFIKIGKSGYPASNIRVVEGLIKHGDLKSTSMAKNHSLEPEEENLIIPSTRRRSNATVCKPVNPAPWRASDQKKVTSSKGQTSEVVNKARKTRTSKLVKKTDLLMKSTLKVINPSIIPQFAGEVAMDRKRKYPEDSIPILPANIPRNKAVCFSKPVTFVEKPEYETKVDFCGNHLEIKPNTVDKQEENQIVSPSIIETKLEPVQSEQNTTRDIIMTGTSLEYQKDLYEELKDFVEPLDGPREFFPDDDEYFLRALPDPQNLFSEEDLFNYLLESPVPSSNVSFESLRPEDMECLFDTKGEVEDKKKHVKAAGGYYAGCFEPNWICVCFRCSYRRRWIQNYYYLLRLRAVRMKEISRLHEADLLKLQDDELLRRIEESFNKKTVTPDNGKSFSSLPLKKRIKKLTQLENDTYSLPTTTQDEKFPSYPMKPMISIAQVPMSDLKKETSSEREKSEIKACKGSPSVKTRSKPDGFQETAVLGQVNSLTKQPEPVIKTPKSPISSSETENSQPHASETFENCVSSEKNRVEGTGRFKPNNKVHTLRRRKSNRKRKDFCNVR